jgi:hypothetical protein
MSTMNLSLPSKLAEHLGIEGEKVKKGRGYTTHFEIADGQYDEIVESLTAIREPTSLYVAARKVLTKWNKDGAKPAPKKRKSRVGRIDEKKFNIRTELGLLDVGQEFIAPYGGRWGKVLHVSEHSVTVEWERYRKRTDIEIETNAPTKSTKGESWSLKTIVYVQTE